MNFLPPEKEECGSNCVITSRSQNFITGFNLKNTFGLHVCTVHPGPYAVIDIARVFGSRADISTELVQYLRYSMLQQDILQR